MINTGSGPRGELRPRTVSAEAVTCGKIEERTDVGPQWTDTAHPGPIRASVSTTIETSTNATRQDRTEQGRRPADPALAGASEGCDLRICRTSPFPPTPQRCPIEPTPRMRQGIDKAIDQRKRPSRMINYREGPQGLALPQRARMGL